MVAKKTVFSLLTMFFFFLFPFLEKNGVKAQTNSLKAINLSENKSPLPLWEKFELTFDIEGLPAGLNKQWPYDPQRPAGFENEPQGITVDGLFTPDNWQTIYVQPGFWHQQMQREEKEDGSHPWEWLYPTKEEHWKIRFSPNKTGAWRYKIRIQTASASWEGAEAGFNVLAPKNNNHGFLKISPTDGRYFEFSDGTPWWGLGHQDSASKDSFETIRKFNDYHQQGLNFLRIWMTGDSIYGAAWQPWASRTMSGQNQWPRAAQVRSENIPGGAYNGHRWAFRLNVSDQAGAKNNPCMFQGWNGKYGSVKPNTEYEIKAIIKTEGIDGPIDPNYDYGFTISKAGWINDCSLADPDHSILKNQSGTPQYIKNTNNQWQIIIGRFKTASNQWKMANTFLKLENTKNGKVYIDKVEIKEILANGQRGENILIKSDFNVQNYYDQFWSYDWDKIIEAAEKNNIFLKLVILEKMDPVFLCVDENGQSVCNPMAGDQYAHNFYSHNNTYVRRLHKYWWRYLKARWGYSRAIHSWELLNEGNPGNSLHFNQAEAMAEYMDQFGAEKQMVSTSTWHSFPLNSFWGNPDYQSIGYYDIHARPSTGTCFKYNDPQTGQSVTDDAALYHYAYGRCLYQGCGGCSSINNYLTNHPEIKRKPVVRGEADLTCSPGHLCSGLENDSQGVWFHNFIWSQVQPYSMYDLLWAQRDINKYDLRWEYSRFLEFLKNIPFNNGNYQDIQAILSHPDKVRAWGQKDNKNGGYASHAYLWLQNKDHTWKNVVEGQSWGRLPGTVSLAGFAPNTSYPIEWWQFDNNVQLSKQIETITADSQGRITLNLNSLDNTMTDAGVKIGDYQQNKILVVLRNYGKTNPGDINNDGLVNAVDFALAAQEE